MKISNLYFILSILALPLFAQEKKRLIYEDFAYEPNIKTVMLYPLVGDPKDPARTLRPAVVALGDDKFVLEFDDLIADYHQFHVKILSCTSDWKLSDLSDVEYLPEFNDFIINEYQVSQMTKVPYYHYRIELPPFKLPGNYIVYAYRDRDKNDIVLSKRCVVYQNRISSSLKVMAAQDPAFRQTHDQIDLEINYNNYPIIDAQEDLKILVRQNYRWDRIIRLKPTATDEIQQKLIFQYFSNENLFPGSNEFRFFDNRNSYNRGMFVQSIQRGKEDEIYIYPQKNRSEDTYIEQSDLNGQYVIDNDETPEDATQADYNWVTIGLKSHELENNKKVYINSLFNNWHLDKSNEMKYENEFGGYVGKFQLKQGIFNYDFIIQDVVSKAIDENYFEGNHSETGNTYEVIIYHKPFGSRVEQVVSYSVFEYNKR